MDAQRRDYPGPGGKHTRTQENQISGLAAGRFVKISISDEGKGIPQEIANRIFDPYFTTKPGAAGLGLSICYSIIKRHNGVIHTDSPAGKGAILAFTFPPIQTRRTRSSRPSRPRVPSAMFL